jgi:hypothetical protein
MQRSDELAPLSREHHQALALALRLRRCTDDDVAELRRDAVAFWQEEAAAHFRAEEELVLPAAAPYVPPSDPDVVRVLVEHVELRRRFHDAGEATAGDLRALGTVLHDHVRHEERVLFPRIEAALTADELAALGAALD